MKKTKKSVIFIIGAILFLAGICAGLLAVNYFNKDKPEEGNKSITLQVESERDNYSFEEKYKTDTEYLGDFLDEKGLIGFEKSDYGRFIKSVQGYEAKDDEQSWWCVLVDGEQAQTGVDEVVLKDGSVYKLELKIGW